MIDYQIKLSQKRKTISIEIDRTQVVIRAPAAVNPETIIEFVNTKHEWISNKINEQLAREARCISHQFRPGDLCYYLGHQYPLVFSFHRHEKTQLINNEYIQVSLTQDSSPKAVEQTLDHWYRLKAQDIIIPLAYDLAEHFKLNITKVGLRRYKRRWGSCNHKQELMFNWRLILAPREAIEYVIIHELCHLDYFDHSAPFWNLVKARCPDYKKSERWLKDYSYALQ